MFVVLSSALIFSQKNTVKKSNLTLNFLAGAAIELGGDSVAEIYFDDNSTQTVNAGQGGSIFVGGELFFSELKKTSLRATVGFKYVTTKATNYSITLTRIPIDFSANYRFAKDFRLAAGIVSHQNIKFNTDGLAANENFSADLGSKIEIAWKWIGLSYTFMDYKDALNNSYNANAFGITLSSSDLF